VQGDDPYLDGSVTTLTITGTAGGNYEQLNTSDTALVTVKDTLDTTTVTLSATASTSEDGGSITYTASLVDANGNAVTTANAVTVSLEGGQTITIGADSSSGSVAVAVNRDDPYLETDSITNRITGVTEANAGQLGAFENLTFDGTVVSTAILDDADTTTVSLSAPESVDEGDSITYTASLGAYPVTVSDVLVQVDIDGTVHTITIAVGQTSGSITLPPPEDEIPPMEHAISNIVLYLRDDGGEFYKVKIDEFSDADDEYFDADDELDLEHFIDVYANGDELVAITVKAGNNGGQCGPGEGELFILDDNIEASDLPLLAHVPDDLTFDFLDVESVLTTDTPPGSISASITGVSGGNFESLIADTTPVTTSIIEDDGDTDTDSDDSGTDTGHGGGGGGGDTGHGSGTGGHGSDHDTGHGGGTGGHGSDDDTGHGGGWAGGHGSDHDTGHGGGGTGGHGSDHDTGHGGGWAGGHGSDHDTGHGGGGTGGHGSDHDTGHGGGWAGGHGSDHDTGHGGSGTGGHGSDHDTGHGGGTGGHGSDDDTGHGGGWAGGHGSDHDTGHGGSGTGGHGSDHDTGHGGGGTGGHGSDHDTGHGGGWAGGHGSDHDTGHGGDSADDDHHGAHGGHSGSDEIDIDWGELLNEKSGKNWVQTLELSPEAHDKLIAGDWTLVVDGNAVDPNHLPGKLHDADVQITTSDGTAIESFQGVDKIEWGNEPGH
jgi:hypothetical protein